MSTQQRSRGEPGRGPASEGIRHHHGTGRDDGTAPCRLDEDPDFLRVAFCAVDRLVRAAHRLYGPLPVVGSPEWRAATWITQAATMAVLGEGYVLRDPDRIAADQLKAASVAIATGADWAAASRRPTLAALDDRRAVPGPVAGSFDAAAAARWVATGSSAEGEGAA